MEKFWNKFIILGFRFWMQKGFTIMCNKKNNNNAFLVWMTFPSENLQQLKDYSIPFLLYNGFNWWVKENYFLIISVVSMTVWKNQKNVENTGKFTTLTVTLFSFNILHLHFFSPIPLILTVKAQSYDRILF